MPCDWTGLIRNAFSKDMLMFQTTIICGRMTDHTDVNMAYLDFRTRPPQWLPQRTDSTSSILRLHFHPLATMRYVTTTLRRTHHDLPHNKNHT